VKRLGYWKEYKLIEVCNFFSDGDWIESKDQSIEGIRLIQTGNIGNGIYFDKIESAKYISEVPVLSEQKRIANIIETKLKAVDQTKQLLNRQLSYINALPSAVLRKAFGGEL
jgi:hypothetical protein